MIEEIWMGVSRYYKRKNQFSFTLWPMEETHPGFTVRYSYN